VNLEQSMLDLADFFEESSRDYLEQAKSETIDYLRGSDTGRGHGYRVAATMIRRRIMRIISRGDGK